MTELELEALVDDHRQKLRLDLPRGLLVDFVEQVKLAAAQSKRTVWKEGPRAPDEIRLQPRRANKVAGLIRHEFVDEVFSEIAERYEGERQGRIQVATADKGEQKPLFLSTFKFGGTLVGFGAHFRREDLPRLNKTRRTLCSLNVGLIPDLLSPARAFDERERFAVLMLQRSPHDIGQYTSISIALVDAQATQYVFQDELSEFLAGYGTSEKKIGRRTVVLRDRKRQAISEA